MSSAIHYIITCVNAIELLTSDVAITYVETFTHDMGTDLMLIPKLNSINENVALYQEFPNDLSLE